MVYIWSATAAMFAIAFFVSIGHQAGWSFSPPVTDFIKNYQALIAGILGLIGGASAYFGIRKQIAENKKDLEVENNKKKAFAYESFYRSLAKASKEVGAHKDIFQRSFFEGKSNEAVIEFVNNFQNNEKIEYIDIPIDQYLYLDQITTYRIAKINSEISSINISVFNIRSNLFHHGVTDEAYNIMETTREIANSLEKYIVETIGYCVSRKSEFIGIFHGSASSPKLSPWERLKSFIK